MRSAIREHSLSIALMCGYVLCSVMTLLYQTGSRGYDFWMSWASAFNGGFVMVILAVKLWERGSDPSRPTNGGRP